MGATGAGVGGGVGSCRRDLENSDSSGGIYRHRRQSPRFPQEARGNAELSEGGMACSPGMVRGGRSQSPDQELGGLPFSLPASPPAPSQETSITLDPIRHRHHVHVGLHQPRMAPTQSPLCPLCPGCSSPSEQGLCVRVPALEKRGDSRPVPPHSQQASLPQVPRETQGDGGEVIAASLWY